MEINPNEAGRKPETPLDFRFVNLFLAPQSVLARHEEHENM